jgi:outer membrane protein OmpA-like peptidoglycan-associated protein
MRNFLLLIIAWIFLQNGFAQKYALKPEYSDCATALEISDTIIHFPKSPKGCGKIVEFKSSDYQSPYYFPSEDNSLWIKFTVPVNCTFSLDIIPDTLSDDYDFLVFKYTGNETDFCNKIISKSLRPLRSIISTNDTSIACKTGLSINETKTNVPPGYGKSYGNAIKANKNEVFYLAINNVYEPNYEDPNYAKGGFVFKLHYFSIINAHLTINDKQTGLPVNANIDIIQNNLPDTLNNSLHSKNVNAFSFTERQNNSYIINVSAKGYLGNNLEFFATNSADTTINITLDKIVSGAKMNIENIYFVGGLAEILPTSFPALEMLFLTLKENPDLKIEIQGHVNCPFNNCSYSPASLQTLSNERALAVQNYLINKGIAQSRMTSKGFSNSKMVYPNATTEDKMKKNRRVEILVISD